MISMKVLFSRGKVLRIMTFLVSYRHEEFHRHLKEGGWR